MCLGEIAEVLQVGPGPRAVVRSGSRPTTVSLLTLEEPVAAGDWVVCHSGFALSRVTATEASEAAVIRATTNTPTTNTPTTNTPTTKATTTEDQQ